MPETRKRFHQELAELGAEIVRAGRMAERAVGDATRSLALCDHAGAKKVIEGDHEIDVRYLDIEHRVFLLLAMQTPVASDLRLVSAVMHMNRHVERIGDQAVNIAKSALLALGLTADPVIATRLEEMSDRVRDMIRTALRAFADRDLELALTLPKLDDPVDALNRGISAEVVRLASDASKLEWGIMMNVVARHLERVGDNAVDLAAQVAFLLTGQFPDFARPDAPARTRQESELS